MENVITFSKARQSARNSLRAYLAGYGQPLPETLGELEAIGPTEAAAKGAVMRDRVEHTPSTPVEAARYAKGNASAWMRPPSAKPQRSKHARRG